MNSVMHKLLVIGGIITLLSPIRLSGVITFEKWYDIRDDDGGFFVQPTSDGGYIITGETAYSGEGSYVLLMKTDSFGDTVWTKTYGSSETPLDRASCVRETSDGGYIIVGKAAPGGPFTEDVWLIKTDYQGDTLWERTYGDTSFGVMERGYSVWETSDSGYVMTGYSSTGGPGTEDIYLIRTDHQGDTLWTRTYGGPMEDLGFSVQQTTDGGYIVAGFTNNGGQHDFYLIKADSSGNPLWTRTYGTGATEQGYSVQQTSDGGYIIGGLSNAYATVDVCLVKTDSLGGPSWFKWHDYLEGDQARSVQQTFDGGYIVAGATKVSTNPAIHPDVYLLKTDSLGDKLWDKSYDRGNHDWGYFAQQTSDSGYIIVGSSRDPATFLFDVYLIKTDAEGNVWGVEELPNGQLPMTDFQLFQNSPNPFSHATTIRYSLPPRGGDTETRRGGDVSTLQLVTLSVYDLTGRLVRTLVDGEQRAGFHTVAWDGRDSSGEKVAGGLYFYRLSAQTDDGESRAFVFSRRTVVVR